MANVRILWRDKAAASTITSSTESYQMEAEKAITAHTTEPWQTSGAGTAEWWKMNLGSAMSVQAFAVINHNFDDTESGINIEGHTSDAWGTPDFTQAVTYRSDVFIEWFSAAQSKQWWRWEFTKNLAADLRQAGKIILGPYYEFVRNPKYDGLEFGPGADTSRTSQNIDGNRFADIGVTLKRVKMMLPSCTQAQVDELDELAQTNGTHTPFILSLDHAIKPVDWLIYGTLEQLSIHSHSRFSGGAHEWDVTLEMIEAK